MFLSNIFLFLQNLEYEFIKEDVGYGTIDLLCDVGGTLSLLMGASLLTCCELLEVAWIVVAKKCYRKVSKTLTKKPRGKRFNSQNAIPIVVPEIEHDPTQQNAAKLQTKV